MEKQLIETNVVKPKLAILHNEIEYRLLSFEFEKNLDDGIFDIESYMASHNGFGQPDAYKDSLYAKAKELWRIYADTLREAKFTFYLNRKQYRYLTTLLNEKLEYDVNTVFLAIELTNMLGTWVQSTDKHKNDTELKGFTSDATEITYMYHLIAKHTVKGLSENTYLFAEILKKIGEISKIINYYDTAAKNLSKVIQDWVAAFEPQEDNQQVENATEETVPAKKLAPKKKKETID
jgi:hypothetical protein